MDYKFYRKTNQGVFSIDNLIVEYTLKNSNIDVIEYLHGLSFKYDLKNEYWERLNTPYCSKYQSYNNHIHLCNGIYLMVGKFIMFPENKDKIITPMVKLELNPNKHFEKPVLKELLTFLKENSGMNDIKKFDYTLDINDKPKNIFVFKTQKEKGLYKGTRYYGQRNKHGYTKIYDKTKESNLDEDITRIETTIEFARLDKVVPFTDVYEKDDETSNMMGNRTLKALTNLVKRCKEYNVDCDDIIDMLDVRAKRTLKSNIDGCGYKKIEYDIDIMNDILNDVKKEFQLYSKPIIKSEFMDLNDYENIEIPFD